MKPVLQKLAFAMCLATIATVVLARDNATTSAAAPLDPLTMVFPAKGPVPLSVTFYSERDNEHLNELRIVTRANVIAVNGAKAVLGVATLMLVGAAYVDSTKKEHMYGDAVTDALERRKLAGPFMHALPAALDQKIAAFVAENPELGGVPFKKAMIVKPSAWNLMYHELLADTEKEDLYVLRFAADIAKVLEGEEGGFLRKTRKTDRSCVYVSPPRALAAWKANDYEAIAGEQKLAVQSCVDYIALHLPQYLGFDAKTKIRAAKDNCKNSLNVCVGEAEKVAEPAEGKLLCKAEYKECVSSEVRPLIDSTPIGMCKATVSACKASVVEKARAMTPPGKPERAELVVCVTDYKTCVAAAR